MWFARHSPALAETTFPARSKPLWQLSATNPLRHFCERRRTSRRGSRSDRSALGRDQTPIVTGAGSGSFMFEVESGAWDEIQPGSYIFMDGDYARNEWAAPLPRFDHALFVLATVMSRPSPHAAVVDA